jgi:hypothetical protein
LVDFTLTNEGFFGQAKAVTITAKQSPEAKIKLLSPRQ